MNEVITAQDVLDSGGCVPGIKKFLDKKKIDRRNFFKNGLPLDEAKSFNDAMVNHVIKVKYGKQ